MFHGEKNNYKKNHDYILIVLLPSHICAFLFVTQHQEYEGFFPSMLISLHQHAQPIPDISDPRISCTFGNRSKLHQLLHELKLHCCLTSQLIWSETHNDPVKDMVLTILYQSSLGKHLSKCTALTDGDLYMFYGECLGN